MNDVNAMLVRDMDGGDSKEVFTKTCRRGADFKRGSAQRAVQARRDTVGTKWKEGFSFQSSFRQKGLQFTQSQTKVV